nr:hypothetical protein [uncultured Allomuricauda sp.]
MIERTPIKNTNAPPYFLGIRGKHFVQMVSIGSAFLLLGVLGGFTTYIMGSYGLTALFCTVSFFGMVFTYLFFRSTGKTIPFKGLRPMVDMITHSNFIKILK